jgi:hypothetical protein
MTPTSGRALTWYVLTVLLPALLAVSLTARQWSNASDAVVFDRHLRGAQTATEVLWQEMGAEQRALAARAPTVSVTPPYPPAIRAAEDGDTISALASSDESLELSVIFFDSAGALRMTREPFHPRVLTVLPSVIGLSISVYLRGRRAVSVDPPFGPLELSPDLLEELGRDVGGVEIRVAEGLGVLRPFRPTRGAPPDVVVLAGDSVAHEAPLSLPTLMAVLGIVLLLSLAAMWTIKRGQSEHGDDRSSLAQSGLIAFIPVLAGIVILATLDRSYRQLVTDSARDEMLRVVAFANEMDFATSPRNVEIATGYEAAYLAPDGAITSSVEDVELSGRLRDVRLPPPNFTSSGAIETSGAPVLYVAGRVPAGGALVILGPDVARRAASLRPVMLVAALGMALPALVYLFLLSGERPRTPPKAVP